MLPKNHGELSSKESQKMGFPDGIKFYSPAPFGSMNQQDSRTGMPDNEFYIVENFIKIGASHLRTLWDKGTAVYTAPTNNHIVYFFAFNIRQNNYIFVCLDDGTGIQVNTATGATTTMAAGGTFHSSGLPNLPACSQWGAIYLLIVNNVTPNSYWIWDGSILYSPGSLAPTVTVTAGGSGYVSAPTVSFSGGSGTGAAATAHVSGGSVISVTITNPGTGYVAGDTVTVAFSGGGGTGATATTSLMPFGVSGSSIETYQQRVWIPFPAPTGTQQNGDEFIVSAPGSLTVFATSAGGLIFNSTDSVLRSQYTNIKQTNGYLYPLGDSSVSVISNVQTSGSPPTTTFNYQNTDPQIGTLWRDSVSAYSRTILFANPLGVYGLYGGAVTKISEKFDDLFNDAIFPPAEGALTPTAAVADIFNKKVYLLLMTIKDPLTFAMRNVMIAWDERDWFLASQTSALTFIGTQEVASNLTAWGTDGSTLFRMFNSASSVLQKRLATKLYGGDNTFIEKLSYGFYVKAQDQSGGTDPLRFSASVDYEFGSVPLPADINISFPAPPPTRPLFACRTEDVYGVNLGCTLTSTSPDFSVSYLGLSYLDNNGVLSADGSGVATGQTEEQQNG